MKTELKLCLKSEEIDLIHEIRERVLFPGLPYDRNHPDDNNPDHLLFLLYVDQKPSATLRLDFLNKSEAALRLVAVLPEFQGKGMGSKLLLKVEIFCRSKGIKKIMTNAKLDSVEFYKRNGFNIEKWDDSGEGIARPTTSMVKWID